MTSLFASDRSTCYICGELTSSARGICTGCYKEPPVDPYVSLVNGLKPEVVVPQPAGMKGVKLACQTTPEMWFSGNPADQRIAKWHCGRCPLKEWCIEHANKNNEP